MGPRRRNKIKELSVQGLEKMTIKGEIFHLCTKCNESFQTEGQAVEHAHLCKSNNSQSTIAEEADSQNQMNNNNYIEVNKTKNFAGRRNSERLKKIVNKSNNFIAVPKKRSTQNRKSNVELNGVSNGVKSLEKVTAPVDNGTEAKLGPKTQLRPRRGKKTTNDQISGRLRKKSETIKQPSEIKVCEDDDEEEREEIEHRLMALNKDTEDTYLDDYMDYEDDISRLNSKQAVANAVKLKTENSQGTVAPVGPPPIIVTQKPDGQLHGCPLCPEVCVSELELFRHKRAMHKRPKITMETSHIKQFYDVEDRSQCPICKQTLTSTSKTFYIKHLQSHNSVGEFVCKVCKRVFKRKDHMKMHEKRHIVLE